MDDLPPTDVMSTPTSLSPPPVPSGRKGSRKVRTGCITCKLRKVKCDEGKPFCLRCVKTGRQCDGYRARTSSSVSAAIVRQPGAGLSFGTPFAGPFFDTDQEGRAFDYFRGRSAPVLGGAVDADFWGGLVLRMSLAEPAVRHALLAMSSLHESLNTSGYTPVTSPGSRGSVTPPPGVTSGAIRRFALTEYGKAITAMRTWDPRRQEPTVPLLVCVLFVTIEFMLDHISASQLHICQGRHILSTLSEADTSGPALEIIRQHLVPVFSRLGLASFLFTGRPAAIPTALFPPDGHAWESTGLFSTFIEARNALHHIMDDTLAFTSNSKKLIYDPETAPEVIASLEASLQTRLSRLSRWRAAFSLFTVEHPPANKSEEASQNLLHLWAASSTVWGSTSLGSCEVYFDAHLPTFSAILTHASLILNIGQEANPHADRSEGPEHFSFETEIIAPVYWTALKCRHPMLRRAALRILSHERVRDKKENLWLGREAMAVAAWVIQMEEAPGVKTEAAEDAKDFQALMVFNGAALDDPLIPTGMPPSLPVRTFASGAPILDDLVETFADEPSTPSYTGSPGEGSNPILELTLPEPLVLEPPYGVPEERRVKNCVIGPKDGDSVWVTLFRDPEPGRSEWSVMRRRVYMY